MQSACKSNHCTAQNWWLNLWFGKQPFKVLQGLAQKEFHTCSTRKGKKEFTLRHSGNVARAEGWGVCCPKSCSPAPSIPEPGVSAAALSCPLLKASSMQEMFLSCPGRISPSPLSLCHVERLPRKTPGWGQREWAHTFPTAWSRGGESLSCQLCS